MRNECQPDLEAAPADGVPRLIFFHSAASHVTGFDGLVTAKAPALAPSCDLLVLAQASTAPVVEAPGDLPVPVLASPALGVERALALLEAAA